MKLTIGKNIGQAIKTKAPIKTYRNNPGNLTIAANAALFYAQQTGNRMVLVPGNSYMNKIYHIVEETASVAKYTVNPTNNTVAVVTPYGKVFQAIAND
jgi:hypothetical protein